MSNSIPIQSLATRTSRLKSIDALRGLVMIFMMLDHVRETFFLHLQVPDPMDVGDTPLGIFIPRMLAHLCAPIFVFLTGLSAYLYASRQDDLHSSRMSASAFLWKRGLFLVLLEVTVVNFAWTFQFPPVKVFLQVIWAIGLSMLALSVMVCMPRKLLIITGIILVAGHNLLDGVHFPVGHILHAPWAVLHDRGWLEIAGIKLRTSYPVMPWIGVIALGYGIGPWFSKNSAATKRGNYLLLAGLGSLATFAFLRMLNVYGDTPWQFGINTTQTLMSWFNVTKYPPSLLFLLLTLGVGLLLLYAFEHSAEHAWIKKLAVFGSAPMFFYILHLYTLKFMYIAAVYFFGENKGKLFGLDNLFWLWGLSLFLVLTLFPAVKWFASLKQARRDIAWLKYL